jgi:transaldolase
MVKLAAQLGWHEIHIQLTENDLASDSKASQLYALGEAFNIDVVLKIPMNDRFIRALPTIRQKSKKILMTACYEAKQMFVAQALGAEYIAPYFGRMVEAGLDAYNELKTMKAIGDSCDTPCRILIASVRSVEQMCQLAREGHDCFTLKPDLITGLVTSPLSDMAIAEFEQAAKK